MAALVGASHLSRSQARDPRLWFAFPFVQQLNQSSLEVVLELSNQGGRCNRIRMIRTAFNAAGLQELHGSEL